MERYDTETQNRVYALSDQVCDRSRLVQISEVGSTAHNISAGDDDLDMVAIWTETFRDLIENAPRRGSKMIRTQPEGVRSGPGDIDLQVYSMRKFVHLCAAGNPSQLLVLFVPADMIMMGAHALPTETIVELSWSRRIVESYQGYLESQLGKWQNGRMTGRPHRPELVDQHGFDTKYAAHAIRLGLQGIELLKTKRLQIPMEEESATKLQELRRGNIPEADALTWARHVEAELQQTADQLDLPNSPDGDAITDFLVDWHQTHG